MRMKHLDTLPCRGELFRLAVIFAALASACFADPVLPNLFSDHMVLQQGREIHVWGQGDPGEAVNVTLAGQSSRATADAHAGWSVLLP